MSENKQLSSIKDFDLQTNTTIRIPICLVVDTSGSMAYKDNIGVSRIDRLAKGILKFYKDVRSDLFLSSAADIALIGYNSEAYEISGFSQQFSEDDELAFKVGGAGNLGLGVNAALDRLEKRKELYRENYVDYYQPWIIILSDGKPTGKGAASDLKAAQARTIELETNRRLVVIPVMISGDMSDQKHEMYARQGYNHLRGFSRRNNPQQIYDIQFMDFFEWLSKSVALSFMDDDIAAFNALGPIAEEWDDFDDL